jgi:hypothetical protein
MPDGYDDEAREALLAKAAQAWEPDPALDPRAIGDGSGEDGVLCYLRAYTSASPPRTWLRRPGWRRWPRRTPCSV